MAEDSTETKKPMIAARERGKFLFSNFRRR